MAHDETAVTDYSPGDSPCGKPKRAARRASFSAVAAVAADLRDRTTADPRERRNVAAANLDVVVRLRELLEALATESVEAAPMDDADEAILTARLEELGYL